MVPEQMMSDLIHYVKTLHNDDIDSIISKLNLIKKNRADELRRASAKKVVEAIKEYLALGEKISIRGGVYNEDWGGEEEIGATFSTYENNDGYLTFNFIP